MALSPGDNAQSLTWWNWRLRWVRWRVQAVCLASEGLLPEDTSKANELILFFFSQSGIPDEKMIAMSMWINIRDDNKTCKAFIDRPVSVFPLTSIQGIKGKPLLFGASPCGSDVKESACNAGDLGSIPVLGRSPGEGHGNSLQYSCLEKSTDRGAWWAAVHGIAKSRTRLSS